jgi:hypothetical protein
MKEPIAQSSALPGNSQDFAIGAFIGLHGFKKTTTGIIRAGVSFNATRNAQRHGAFSQAACIGDAAMGRI